MRPGSELNRLLELCERTSVTVSPPGRNRASSLPKSGDVLLYPQTVNNFCVDDSYFAHHSLLSQARTLPYLDILSIGFYRPMEQNVMPREPSAIHTTRHSGRRSFPGRNGNDVVTPPGAAFRFCVFVPLSQLWLFAQVLIDKRAERRLDDVTLGRAP